MPLYQANFRGCKSGAIGIHYTIETTVRGTDEKDAEIRLYDRYDHIAKLTLVEIPEQYAATS